jgi:hypothetical protein
LFALGSLWAISQDGTDAWPVRSRRLGLIAVAVAIGFALGALTGAHVSATAAQIAILVSCAAVSGFAQSSGLASAGMYGLLGVVVGTAFGTPTTLWQTPLLATGGVAWVVLVAAVMDRRGRHAICRQCIADALDAVDVALRENGTQRRVAARDRAVSALDVAQDAVGVNPPRRGLAEGVALRQCLLIALRAGELVSYFGAASSQPVTIGALSELSHALRTSTAVAALQTLSPPGPAMSPAIAAALTPPAMEVAVRWSPRKVPSFRPPLRERVRFGLLLAACVGAAGWVADSLRGPHSFWLPMSVAFILRPDLGPVMARSVARMGGTLVGVGIAGLVAITGNRPAALILLSCAMATLMPAAIRKGHAYAVMTFTPIVFTFIAMLGSDKGLLLPRIVDTVIAAAFVLAVDAVAWTSAPSLRADAQLLRAHDAVAAYLETDAATAVPDRRLRRRSAVRAASDAMSAITMSEREPSVFARKVPGARQEVRELFREIDQHTVRLVEASLP